MGVVQKRTRKKRVNWRPGAKLEMPSRSAFRPDYRGIPKVEQKYYPNRGVKTLGALIRTMRKQSCDEEEEEEEEAMMTSSTVPTTTSSTTSRKRTAMATTAFEFSDEDVSSSDEQVEDISYTGVRTRNKRNKTSYSAEALPSLNAVQSRESSIQSEDSQTTEGVKHSPQFEKSSTVVSCVEPVTNCAESQLSIISCANQSQHETSPLERPEGCVKTNGDNTQVPTILSIQEQEHTQVDHIQKQKMSPESAIRQDNAKKIASISSQLQELCQSQEMMFSLCSQIRAQNLDLQKQCDEKDSQLAQAQEDAESWQTEKEKLVNENENLVNENTSLAKKLEMMKDILG